MADSGTAAHDPADGDGFAYLLVQLGFHLAGRFAEQLAPLGLEPRQFGMLSRLAANEGRSQQAIGELMGLNPTRMVFLVDELEKRGLVERRRNPADRRSHALYLTDQGWATLREAQQVSAGHAGQVGASLTGEQRAQLTTLLRQLADEQGITGQGLPGPPPPGVR
jgi:DNA-binding MarR family transcriptional regulator